jgi:hypothetical protein
LGISLFRFLFFIHISFLTRGLPSRHHVLYLARRRARPPRRHGAHASPSSKARASQPLPAGQSFDHPEDGDDDPGHEAKENARNPRKSSLVLYCEGKRTKPSMMVKFTQKVSRSDG